MIVQQVNLYQDSVKQKQPDLGIYFIAGAVLIIFLLGFGWLNYAILSSLHENRALVEKKQQQLIAEQTHVAELQAKVPKPEMDASLITQLKQWENKLAELKQVIATLDNDKGFAAQGFSPYFQALANNPLPEIWLTAIRLNAAEKLIKFEGSTFKTDKIPYFLQQLQQETVFHGHTFATLTIRNAEKNPKLMNFKLSTRPEILKKDDVK